MPPEANRDEALFAWIALIHHGDGQIIAEHCLSFGRKLDTVFLKVLPRFVRIPFETH